MISLILSSILAFVGTNIDDILVLTLLLTRVDGRRGRLRVGAGYLLGVLVLSALSAMAAFGLRLISGNWLRLLGLIPIALGVRAWFAGDDDSDGGLRASLVGAALITLGNGADNLGVYVALFARITVPETALSALVFLGMAVLWVFFASRLADLPALRRFIERRSRIVVPLVFVLLGIYILFL